MFHPAVSMHQWRIMFFFKIIFTPCNYKSCTSFILFTNHRDWFVSFDLLTSVIVNAFYLAIEDNHRQGEHMWHTGTLYLYYTLSTTGGWLFIVAVQCTLIESLLAVHHKQIMLLDNFLIDSLPSCVIYHHKMFNHLFLVISTVMFHPWMSIIN